MTCQPSGSWSSAVVPATIHSGKAAKIQITFYDVSDDWRRMKLEEKIHAFNSNDPIWKLKKTIRLRVKTFLREVCLYFLLPDIFYSLKVTRVAARQGGTYAFRTDMRVWRPYSGETRGRTRNHGQLTDWKPDGRTLSSRTVTSRHSR